jgi:hypothetical protein
VLLVKAHRTFLAVALLSGLSACVAYVPAHARGVVEIGVAPPPPRVIVVPEPRVGYVWAPGYWRWNGRTHVWVDGVWMRERRGYHWEPAHWEERHGRYHFEEGHWVR